MKQQGDVKIQGGKGEGLEEVSKIEFQASASPVGHFALMFNYAQYSAETETSYGNGYTTKEGGEGTLAELGAGYYGALSNKRWIYECYIGYGSGKGQNTFTSGTTSFKVNRFFLQPNVGFSHNIFDAIFSIRGAYLNYTDVRQFTDPFYSPDAPLYERGYFVLEPAFTARAGYKFAKLQFQLGFSHNLTQKDFSQEQTYVSLMLMVDLQRAYFKGGK